MNVDPDEKFADRLDSLFADARPPVEFEDRLIARLRESPVTPPRRRLRLSELKIPRVHPWVTGAAASAAAVMLLATTGYVGTQLMHGDSPLAFLHRDTPQHVRAASNLRQIGQAILLYGNDNKGLYPRTIATWGTGATATDPFAARTQDFVIAVTSGPTTQPFVAPSSNAEKWDFGGGANTKLNWSNWNNTAGAQHNLSYSYSNPQPSNTAVATGFKLNQSPNNHDEDGQNVLYGEGHTNVEQNPFRSFRSGQRDNVDANKSASAGPRSDGVPSPIAPGSPPPAASSSSDVRINVNSANRNELEKAFAVQRERETVAFPNLKAPGTNGVKVVDADGDGIADRGLSRVDRARPGLAKGLDGDADAETTDKKLQDQHAVEIARAKADAAERLRTRLSPEDESKRRAVSDLVRTTRQYVEQGKYSEALGVVDQILVIDPKNDYAIGVRPLIEDKALFLEQRKYREQFDRNFNTQVARGEEQKIPYNDILRYPDNWPDLPETHEKHVVAERSEITADVQTSAQLGRVLPEINFATVPFGDVVDFLRDITQSNIFVNWKALEAAGVDRSTPVTQRLRNVEFGKALNTVLNDVGGAGKLGYALDDGIVSISTIEDLNQNGTPPVPQLKYLDTGYEESQEGTGFGPTTSPSTQPGARSAAQPADPGVAGRAIIRTGVMEFEVESFDVAFNQIKRLVAETGGYVGAINSEKLVNGKIRGTLTLRVPPERTDELVTKLRPLGELKRQNLAAEEVTKQIFDLQQQLDTAKTMQERLGELSQSKTGEVKDKVAAEREAGQWRQRAEQAQSQLSSLKNQVALATLTVVLNEKGIDVSAAVRESETADMGVETEDVTKARDDATKAIDDAKGRIVESQLKQFDAGQLAAKVVAEVAPERAGEVMDRMKQLGKVARLDVQRQTTTPNNATPAPGSRVERGPTRLTVSFYNLANVSPRVTTNLNVAVDDVEAAYRTVIDRVLAAGGRVISSNMTRQQADQQQGTATVSFELKTADADAVLNDVRGTGEVMRLDSTQNTDTNNVTSAKRGFAVQIVSVASAAPRQVTTRSVAAADVPNAYEAVLAAAHKAKARIIVSKLEQQSGQPTSAWLDFEVRRTDAGTVETALAAAGDAIATNVTVSADASNTLESKVQYKLSLQPADQLSPREATNLGIATTHVEESVASATKAVTDAGGRALDANVSKEASGRTTARLSFDLPLNKSAGVIEQLKSLGTVRVHQTSKNAQVPAGQLARARVDVILADPEGIVEADQGLWASLRRGLATSAAGLLWSVQLVIVGLCLIAPWALALWGGWRLARRIRRQRAAAVTT